MNACMRCGDKVAHNYLTAQFTITDEKRKRVVVCSKCKEILGKMGDVPGITNKGVPEKNRKGQPSEQIGERPQQL